MGGCPASSWLGVFRRWPGRDNESLRKRKKRKKVKKKREKKKILEAAKKRGEARVLPPQRRPTRKAAGKEFFGLDLRFFFHAEHSRLRSWLGHFTEKEFNTEITEEGPEAQRATEKKKKTERVFPARAKDAKKAEEKPATRKTRSHN